jgi:PKD repeat protein
VSLTVTNAQGSNTLTIPNYITVGEEPFADFDYQIDDFTVDFDNQSQFGDSYHWDFGDGESSTLTNPIHVYDEDGVYTVTLTTTNECGSDTYTVEIEIITTPFADFASSDPSDNADSYSWSFPGGSPPSSSLFEPTVLYEIPGTYNVSLTVYNEAGEDTYTAFNYITVFAVPEADFTYVANGLSVSFNSSSSSGDSFLWNFGDGHISSQENPVHVYSSGGTYTVTLTVTSDCGSDVISLIVNVTGAPVADFVADVEYGCAPLVVQFESTSLGNPTSYSWVFQGGVPGTSSLANPVVTYTTPGIYDVQLTVTNASGNNTLLLNDFIEVESPTFSDFDYFINGLQATFSNQSQHSTGSIWHFGDGETSNQNNPVHVYHQDGVYQVMLISTGICGNDTSTAQLTIQTPPQAGFTFIQNDFCIPSAVSFTNESSPNATSFAWTFEGGSPATSNLENPVVTYYTVGSFDVTLIAYSPAGSDTMSWSQLVTVGDIPNAAFLISTNGLSVDFQNQSTDGDTYIWLFGDSNSSTEESPSHTYADFGIYDVILIATNECGNDTMEIIIELSTVPNAFFSFSGHTGCAPFEVQFVDQSQNNPTSWSWTFEGGNPGTSNLQNPLVSYATPGDYFVSLQVQNGQGSDVLVLDDVIHVAGTPDATFSHSQNENIISLEYPGLDYDSLKWSFGDGRTDNSLNPTVEYHVSGSYLIQLIVYNACGTDTADITVEIIISGTSDPAHLEGNWQIRPNPFHDLLLIHGEPATEGTLQIILRDIQGRVLMVDEWNHLAGSSSKEIHSGHLPSGMILVELKNASARTVLKAVHL